MRSFFPVLAGLASGVRVSATFLTRLDSVAENYSGTRTCVDVVHVASRIRLIPLGALRERNSWSVENEVFGVNAEVAFDAVRLCKRRRNG
jgi:hypothetical protein